MKGASNIYQSFIQAIRPIALRLKIQHHRDRRLAKNSESIFIKLSKIYSSIISLTPFHITLRVALFLFSQISLLLTIILPWKLIVLISTEHLPYGMPTSLQHLTIDNQINLTIYAIAAALIVYLLCDIASDHINRKGADSILSANGKTGLFSNYKDLSSKSYGCVSDSIASLTFSLLVISWLITVYPLLLLPVFTFPILFFFFRSTLSNKIKTSPPSSGQDIWHKIWIHTGFIYSLTWVIIDYFHGRAPSIIISFISLLSIRQFFIVSLNMGLRVNFITRNIDRISSLFVSSSVWEPRSNTHGLQKLAEKTQREELINKILQQESIKNSELKTSCRLASQGYIAYLEAYISPSKNDIEAHSRLIKVYTNSKIASAEHELAILKESKAHWPSPKVIGNGTVENMFYISMSWRNDRTWLDAHARKKHLQEMIAKIISCDISEDLSSRYERTHPSLEYKLKSIDWEVVLELSSCSSNRKRLLLAQSCWDSFVKGLSRLPRQIVIPDPTGRLTSISPAKEIYLCNWSNWRWEPIGSSWPFDHTLSDPILHILNYASQYRGEIKDVGVNDIKAASLASKLVSAIDRHDYHVAEKLIINIYSILEKEPLMN